MFCDEHGTVNYCPDCFADEKDKRIEELEAENKALREFICHHGGLINEWASEYIEHKLDFWLEEK